MVEGVSGLLAVHKHKERPEWISSRRRLVWPNGAVAQVFSAEDPESLRGPQFSAAWCDELAKWRHADATFDMLQFGLRLGVAGVHIAHPLRAGAGLAGAAAAENEPGGPVGAAVGALGRALVGVRELTKIGPEVFNLAER